MVPLWRLKIILYIGWAWSCTLHAEIEVLHRAHEENKVVIAAFLQDPPCPWSQALEQEVLDHPDFVERVGAEALVWKVRMCDRMRALGLKYHLQDYPTLLLLDPNGKEFARMGYDPLEARLFGDKIHGLIEDFHQICAALDTTTAVIEEAQWQRLYQKSKGLSASCYRQFLLERGVKQEKGYFFHLEKYAYLLEKYKKKHSQVKRCKEQLLKRAHVCRAEGVPLHVAVLEFQALALRSEKKQRCERALKPLLQYLAQYGKKYPNTVWQVEWMIADYLFTKHVPDMARKHAYRAYEHAPESERQHIQKCLEHIALPGL